MLRLGTSYAKYFNTKYEEVGSLFQDRFKAKLIGRDEFLLHLSRYIHRNPKEILPANALLSDYLWSSYPVYLHKLNDNLTEFSYILIFFSKVNPSKDYKNFVEYEQDNDHSLIKELIFES